jgi:hypothetical protein
VEGMEAVTVIVGRFSKYVVFTVVQSTYSTYLAVLCKCSEDFWPT